MIGSRLIGHLEERDARLEGEDQIVPFLRRTTLERNTGDKDLVLGVIYEWN
jgi:hypothetical protein